jgi:hypothetical protein
MIKNIKELQNRGKQMAYKYTPKWSNVSKREQQYHRNWLKNKIYMSNPSLVNNIPDYALIRSYNYMKSLPAGNKNSGGRYYRYDNTKGDNIFNPRNNTNYEAAFTEYIITNKKPKQHQSSFISDFSSGMITGSKLIGKSALDPLSLGIDAVEGINKEGLNFKALDGVEKDVDEYTPKQAAIDLAINVATAGAGKIAGKVGGKIIKKIAGKIGKTGKAGVTAAEEVAEEAATAVEGAGVKTAGGGKSNIALTAEQQEEKTI